MDEFLAGGDLCRLAVLDERGLALRRSRSGTSGIPSEGVFWIVARKKSAWAGHMPRDARVALTIDGDTRPYRKVAVQGTAEVVEEPNVGGRWVEIARRMAVRYLGEHGPDYIVPTLDKPRWLFKISPDRPPHLAGRRMAQALQDDRGLNGAPGRLGPQGQ